VPFGYFSGFLTRVALRPVLQMTTSCPLLSKTPLGAKCCALGERIFGDSAPIYRRGIRPQGLFWPQRLGLGWAQAGYPGRIGSAGAAVGFGYTFEGFFDVLAASRPGGFLANLACDF
jgi:hypothetical protein